MRDVATQYRWACHGLPEPTHGRPSATAGDPSHPRGALLHLTAARAAAVFALARPSRRSHAAAVTHIVRLDAASEGVTMGKVGGGLTCFTQAGRTKACPMAVED